MPTSTSSIIIDATHFAVEKPTGVELYTDNPLPELSSLLIKKGWGVSWVGHSQQAPAGMPQGVSWMHSPYKRFWSQAALRALLTAKKPDLFFSPSGLAPLLYRGKTATVLHDLAAFIDPSSFTFGQRVRLKTLMARDAKRASAVIAPSRYTAQRIERFLRIPAERIAVTPLAIPEKPSAKELVVPGLPEKAPSILFMGRIERKKNLLPLVRGFAQVDSAQAPYLVLAGGMGHGGSAVAKEVAKLPEAVRNRILLPGYVNEGQKEWLYKRAVAVAVPGLLEGFGLPALEAFSYGVPALCSQAGSLPEVAAEAALYVQGDIATDWRLQLENILTDEPLRKELVQAGSKRLKDFSWSETARLTAEALENAAK